VRRVTEPGDQNDAVRTVRRQVNWRDYWRAPWLKRSESPIYRCFFEAAIFTGLAVALLTFTAWWVRYRVS